MRKLKIDLELLVQSFAFDDEELGVEYLDKDNGEIKWKFTLEAADKKDLELKYIVKYPKDRKLTIE